jgi:hypothetical protein
MNDFAKLFLNDDWKSMPDVPRFYVSAFGKHPGWNDHLDDIGVVTDSLVRGKAIIYGGIAHQVENAVWEKAGAGKVAPGFDHVIHWRRLHESLTGLMWSSRDGKGRSLYPMILLGHCAGQPFDWQAAELLPALREAGEKCRGTASSSMVVAVLDSAQSALRGRLPGQPAGTQHDSPVGVQKWVAHFARERDVLRRVLHHLNVNCAAFAPGSEAWCGHKQQPRGLSYRLRLPAVPGADAAESLNAWLSFLATQLDPAVPLLGLGPQAREWIDVIIGEPSEADLVVLRTLPAAAPVVSDIPYQLSPSLTPDENRIFTDLAQGRLPGVSFLNSADVEANRQKSLQWLGKFRTNFLTRLLRSTGSPF